MAHLIAVIGCGNPNRSDDGFGGQVVRRLAARKGPHVKILDAGTDGMRVMFAARGCTTLVVVDACSTGAEPGTLFEVPADVVAAPHTPALTLHDFRWDHALHAGRKLYGTEFPSDVTVFLAEAGSLALGLELTPEVEGAVDRTVARIEHLLADRGA